MAWYFVFWMQGHSCCHPPNLHPRVFLKPIQDASSCSRFLFCMFICVTTRMHPRYFLLPCNFRSFRLFSWTLTPGSGNIFLNSEKEYLCSLKKENLHQTSWKGKEDFIHNYCNRSQDYSNRGGSLNSTLLKQKAGEFQWAGGKCWRSFERWLVSLIKPSVFANWYL